MVSRHGSDRVSYSILFDIGTCRSGATFAPVTAIGDDRDWVGLHYRSFSMTIRLLAFAIGALSSAHVTTAAAQSVYVAPGGVFIGGGPVYVVPAPSTYAEPIYGYGVPEPTPYLAPTVLAPGAGYVAATLYGNGYGHGYGYGNGYANGYGYGNDYANSSDNRNGHALGSAA